MGEDFYLTLPSDSSMDQYPRNVPGAFYTKLPQTIDLSGKNYEIGLAEVLFPNTYTNIGDNEMMLIVQPEPKLGFKTLTLPKGLYDTPESLISALNEKLVDVYAAAYEDNMIKRTKMKMEIKNAPKFFYDRVTKRAKLKIYKEDCLVKLNPSLAKILRMHVEMMDKLGANEGTGVVDVHKESNMMYIYCDLVRHRQVGDMMVPLLRVVPTHEKSGHVTYRIFEKPHYQPLARQQFNTIEIVLSTDAGKIPSFASGKTVVTLHLRPRPFQ